MSKRIVDGTIPEEAYELRRKFALTQHR